MAYFLASSRNPGGLPLFVALLLACTAGAQQPSPATSKAEALRRAGTAALARNDFATALTDFQQVAQLLPSSEPAHSSLGAVLLRMGRASESVPELEQALKLKPSDPEVQVNLAGAYEQLGQPEKSFALLSRTEAADRAQGRPAPAYIAAAEARALVATHQLPSAVTHMKQAVTAEPRNAGYQDNLGSLYAMQADWPNAEQSFRAAIAANPKFALAHLHLGLTLETQQRPGAMDELNTAHRLDPQNSTVDLELGRALAAQGNDGQAVPLLEMANRSAPQNSDAAYQLALALQRTDRLPEALPLFRNAAAAQPENPDVLTNFGLALLQQGAAAEAVPLLQKAVALAPENPTSLQNLAAAYIQLNRVDDAIAQLRAAIPLNPEAAQLHYNLGLAYKMHDDAAHAIPELEQAEKLDPNQPEAKYALGMLYMQNARYEDAARELSRSLSMQPNNGDGWATLGSVYSKLEKLPDAETALRQAIAQLPLQPDPHLTLAAVLVKEGKPQDAVAERKTAADLMRSNMNRQRAEVATHSGDALLQRGDLDAAKVQFQDALSFDPSYKDAHQGLARVFDAQGKNTEAAAERAKVPAGQQ